MTLRGAAKDRQVGALPQAPQEDLSPLDTFVCGYEHPLLDRISLGRSENIELVACKGVQRTSDLWRGLGQTGGPRRRIVDGVESPNLLILSRLGGIILSRAESAALSCKFLHPLRFSDSYFDIIGAAPACLFPRGLTGVKWCGGRGC